MRRKIYAISLCACLVCGLFASCLKDDDATVALPKPFISIPNSMVPQAIVDSLQRYMSIYDGVTPPVIEGSYLANPVQLIYASDGYYNDHFFDVYFTCASQDCRGWISYIERQNSALLGTDSAIVTGADDHFTMTCIAPMADEVQGWNCKLAIIASGTVSMGGISNFQYATVMLDKYDPDDVLLDVHTFRVYSDGDTFAHDTVWSYDTKIPYHEGFDVTCSRYFKGGLQ